ncbi:amino acid/polyamine/organocation transporter, APC superfamily [Halobacillus dabanensis]|uniref:Amino acid/polyamine/organocation transporter, APC superfamily n=2 Tax=Halobacillus dabanensis TaxID=240302 RepID=A0A1I3UVB5_HALDA|nr:amino acid permease [Halobacillus dabanensis]SFJ86842.1 amino acid/polyamine/organocation transporter, APC superfamily [Halobacillus dabanensis]
MSCSTSGGQGSKNEKQGNLKWWQLSLVGVGCTIGTGYFLGSSIGITITGPSIVFSFLLAAIGTYAVFNLLAKMTAKDPQEGSFCYYAGKAFGRWARFSCGWNYWWSTTLIMGSQLIALSILSQFWFPNVPLWVFAGGYAILSILVVLMGTKSFDKVEDILAVIKTAAIIMFILLGAAALLGWIPGGPDQKTGFPNTRDELFPEGFSGFWASLIYAFYAFGGIEVIGLMAIRLKNKEDAPKSGTIMLLLLTVIYVLSLGLAVTMVSVDAIDPNESPFVTALADYKLAFFPHVFNAAIIIAGFSTLTAALFGVTTLLVTIAKDGDAPSIFAKKLKNFKELPLPSLGLGAIGLMASVITALLLPDKTYEYITTAAGILLLYNWTFIILSSFRILKETKMFAKIVSIVGLILILAAISGTLVEESIRPGLFISLLLTAIIAGVTFIMSRKWKKS